jgi:hypothetical protein
MTCLGECVLPFIREPPATFLVALDSHNLWVSFWGADQAPWYVRSNPKKTFPGFNWTRA